MTRALFLEAPATSRGPLPWLLALGAGLAQAASLAWPGPGSLAGQPLWWLQILSLALLGRVLLGAGSARRAALLGWLFATSWLVGTFWWLFISMHTYGGLAAPLAALAVLALALFLASYYAAVSALFWRVAPNCRAQAAIVFAALWL
ncbi:MAG TPA: apolipoprotein N-acyltransferase, partial [Alicycliphilus sp.]|nr:apolipoprotein N-acyltransferase [Alicycliphilus sp.]